MRFGLVQKALFLNPCKHNIEDVVFGRDVVYRYFTFDAQQVFLAVPLSPFFFAKISRIWFGFVAAKSLREGYVEIIDKR